MIVYARHHVTNIGIILFHLSKATKAFIPVRLYRLFENYL
jgi:hypothetical protein